MGRIKKNREEMEEKGLRPEPGETYFYNFMNRRADAFERNELDPETLNNLLAELKNSASRKYDI